jgi:hypothetical protein
LPFRASGTVDLRCKATTVIKMFSVFKAPVDRCLPRSFSNQHSFSIQIGLFAIWCSVLLLLTVFGNEQESKPNTLLPRSAGNSDFAQDIYGIGVRVGLYLQAVSAMVVALRPLRQPGGASPLILSSIISISILGSWTRRAMLNDIQQRQSSLLIY